MKIKTRLKKAIAKMLSKLEEELASEDYPSALETCSFLKADISFATWLSKEKE